MPYRTVILSDLHLGRPYASAGTAEALRPLWQGAKHLVINGDLAELHHPTFRSEAARQTMRLYELCEQDGVGLTLLSGNHDAYLSDVRHLSLAQGKVFVTHGDVLHPAIAPWSPNAPTLRRAYEHAYERLEPETRNHLINRLQAAQHAGFAEWRSQEYCPTGLELSHFVRRPWLVAVLLHYWFTLPAKAGAFVKEHAPEARFFVLGHTHRHGIWHVNGVHIINTGCFGFPGRPLAVVLEKNHLTVWPIKRHDDTYHLARAPRRVFDLPTHTLGREMPATVRAMPMISTFT